MNSIPWDRGDDSMDQGSRDTAPWQPRRLPHADVEQAKLSILDALRGYGITGLSVSYDGYGDEGGYTLLDCRPYSASARLSEPAPEAAAKLAAFCGREPSTTPIIEAIFDLASIALDGYFGGWETGEGASGEFVLDVVQGTCVLQHSRRIAYDYPAIEL